MNVWCKRVKPLNRDLDCNPDRDLNNVAPCNRVNDLHLNHSQLIEISMNLMNQKMQLRIYQWPKFVYVKYLTKKIISKIKNDMKTINNK